MEILIANRPTAFSKYNSRRLLSYIMTNDAEEREIKSILRALTQIEIELLENRWFDSIILTKILYYCYFNGL